MRLEEGCSLDGSLSDLEKKSTFVRVDMKKFCRSMRALLAYIIDRSSAGTVITVSSNIISISDLNGQSVPDAFNKILRLTVVDEGAEITQVWY